MLDSREAESLMCFFSELEKIPDLPYPYLVGIRKEHSRCLTPCAGHLFYVRTTKNKEDDADISFKAKQI
jgi:hypothetical protein